MGSPNTTRPCPPPPEPRTVLVLLRSVTLEGLPEVYSNCKRYGDLFPRAPPLLNKSSYDA